MQITEAQLYVNGLNLRRKHIRLELLDFDFKTIDTLEGVAVGGSLSENADDNIRRSGNIELAIPIDKGESFLSSLKEYDIDLGGKIWLDRYIKIFVGIDDFTQVPTQVIWYNKGIFLIDEPSRNFSAEQYTLSFSVVDIMAKLTGSRQGQFSGSGVIFEAKQTDTTTTPPTVVRLETIQVLKAIIEEYAGLTKYSIYPIPQDYKYIPSDYTFNVGATIYDMLKQVMDYLSTWEMFFDTEGVLVIQPIPSGVNDPSFPIEYEQQISNQSSVSFQNVKNQVIIYGKLNSTTYYTSNTETVANNVEYSADTLILRYSALNTDNFTVLGTNFGFGSLSVYNSQPLTKIKIYNNTTLVIDTDLVAFEGYDSTTQTKTYMSTNDILPNTIYIIRILNASLTSESKIDFTKPIIMEFYSKEDVNWCLVNDNKESPFYINGNLKGENYYCGTSFTDFDNYNLGENYLLTLNNDDNITSIGNGTILTFMANADNKYRNSTSPLNATTVTIRSQNGTILLRNIPIVQNYWVKNTSGVYYRQPVIENKITSDYVIWELKYDMINYQMVFLGRFPYAITQVFTGGEYDVIFADRLAYERCVWELFSHSNMNDTIKIGQVPNYGLSVNYKIPFYESWSKPQGLSDYEQYQVQAQIPPNGDVQDFEVQLYGDNTQDYLVKAQPKADYFMIKNITFPLGLDNTPQEITAIQIYDSGNLVGSAYNN